ncbi:MAG: cation:proton antiporter [Candidatus Hydrogenedentes bacterium]|nr:cation:proton antiporter [Candidatus Hydrogenedentota bacterium]
METLNTAVLMILGIGVFGGIVGASIFQRLHIPQVVGYIAMGLLVGNMGLNIVTPEDVKNLQVLNLFALGIIGFLVGGELELGLLRKKGKQLLLILLFEGLGAFFIVGIPITLLVYFFSENLPTALAAGIVFGAIASATDPASTLNVLWEYRSRGVLTTTLIAIVALDDALAMTLYGIGTTVARLLTGESASMLHEVLKTSAELGGAILLGVTSGFLLRYMIRWLKQLEQAFATTIGAILIIIGIAATLGMDVILAAMTLGVTLRNIAPRQSKELFSTVRSFATPIYVIFFVLVGARLELTEMPGWVWGIVALYLIGRSIGKVAGAYAGGRIADAEPAVRNNVGMGLFAQGGIAVGLSIMAAHHLEGVVIADGMLLSDVIIFGVTASTIVLQITGPPLIKLASKRAGELGRDVTEEDVISSWTAADAMISGIDPIPLDLPLTEVFRNFAENDHLVYPVVDREGALKGVISLDELKGVLATQDTWDWVLAADVMAPARDKVSPETPLEDALEHMRLHEIEEMPVVADGAESRPVGILDRRGARIRINEELVRRRQTA